MSKTKQPSFRITDEQGNGWVESLSRIFCACEGPHVRNCKVGRSIRERESVLKKLDQITNQLDRVAKDIDDLGKKTFWRGIAPCLFLFEDSARYSRAIRACATKLKAERRDIAGFVTLREDIRRVPIALIFDKLRWENPTIPKAELHRAIADLLNDKIGFPRNHPHTEAGIRKCIGQVAEKRAATREDFNRAVKDLGKKAPARSSK